MSFIRSFFINVLAAFFINRMAPGVEIGFYDHVPNIGADLLFSVIVGFLNGAVFPALFILELEPTPRKMAILTFLVSYGCYIAIAILPFGVQATSVMGVVIAGTFVWIAGFVTNYLEWKQDIKKQ